MTIEPHHAFTVRIRAAAPDHGRSPEEYAANVAARFGKDGKLPSWADLAKLENRAMWARLGRQHKGEPEAKAENRVEAMRATWQAKAAESRQDVIRVLSKPMTTGDVARELSIESHHTAYTRLNGMAEEGLIVMRKVKGVCVWERKAEADDAPEHQQAKPVTVRGETFPSMSACARHFGISVQAVADRIRRGATDTIVMRKEAAE